mmetsp:Transcript_45306/g.98289  ORF Transcript_45306/g.98289 Transcript_45306/m.98289 type:complete len:222 (+) Transcript_45306:1823-2488(+)
MLKPVVRSIIAVMLGDIVREILYRGVLVELRGRPDPAPPRNHAVIPWRYLDTAGKIGIPGSSGPRTIQLQPRHIIHLAFDVGLVDIRPRPQPTRGVPSLLPRWPLAIQATPAEIGVGSLVAVVPSVPRALLVRLALLLAVGGVGLLPEVPDGLVVGGAAVHHIQACVLLPLRLHHLVRGPLRLQLHPPTDLRLLPRVRPDRQPRLLGPDLYRLLDLVPSRP